jgi:hypothetical protein
MNNVRVGGSGGGEEQDPVRVSENNADRYGSSARVYRWERGRVDVDVRGRHLVREHHQVGVQRDRVQDMAPNVERDGNDDTPVVLGDGPFHGDDRSGEDDDAREGEDREDESDTEARKDLGDFHEEIGALDFLLCCTPGDVVREHVSQHGLGQVDRETTKEDEATRR